MKKIFSFLPLLFLCGCSSAYTILPSIPAAYFTTISIHEGGHALVGAINHANHINMEVVPGRYDGKFHLGFTTITSSSDLSELNMTLFNSAGVIGSSFLHIGTRIALRSGLIPEVLQPFTQWTACISGISTYGEIIFGLMRLKSADLGKENIGISLAFLAGNLAFDVADLLSDNFTRYVGTLFGFASYKKLPVTLTLGPSSANLTYEW